MHKKFSSALLYDYLADEQTNNAVFSAARYEIMLLCWSLDAPTRPNFSCLVKTLSGVLESQSDYLELSNSLNLRQASELTTGTAPAAVVDEDII